MNPIQKHLDKKNLHHAYLIEGDRDEVVPEILIFLKSLDIKTLGNPDFCHISIDSFKMEEALNLRSVGSERGFSLGKKIFIVSANSFTLDAQGTLLKMFEEPIENTHFFIITPDASILLKTLFSRFYFISTGSKLVEETKNAEKFLSMSLRNRIDFIKELLAESEEEDEEGNEILALDSARSKSLKFLNALENVLHNKMSKGIFDTKYFEHLLKVREFLRMPGSSTKILMESVALVVPEKVL